MVEVDRIKIGNRTSIIGICCNAALAVAKIVLGSVSGMISIVADGINNFSDAISNIVSLIGFRMSSKPADDEHPFGHARFEYISGLVVAFLVMLAGVELLQSSFGKLIKPEASEVTYMTFIVLSLSIVVKLGMSVMYHKVGVRIASSAIEAASQDARNDCISTGAVLIAAVIMYFSGVNLDGIMGILVALFILYSGIQLVKDTISPLLGSTPDEEFVQEIEKKVLSYDGVLGTHDLMVHDYGPGHCFASVHVEVPAERSVLECHEIIDQIEHDFMVDMHMHMVIHYDPIVTADERVGELREFISKEAKKLDESLSIHDLRIVPGEDNTNVIFDCVVPRSCKISEKEIVEKLKNRLKEEYPKHSGVIKIDHSYVSVG